LVEIQFPTTIKKLKTDNGDEYVKKEMTAFLETKGIIHDLSRTFPNESNDLSELMNRTIVMMVRSMTFDSTDVISRALWAKAYSTAINIKNSLPHNAFKLKKLPYEIMFSDKPSIKYLYPFGAKGYVHVPEEKQIRTS
jgi:hypothetical protein